MVMFLALLMYLAMLLLANLMRRLFGTDLRL